MSMKWFDMICYVWEEEIVYFISMLLYNCEVNFCIYFKSMIGNIILCMVVG